MSKLYFCSSMEVMPIRHFHERFKEARDRIPGLNNYKLWKASGVGESLLSKIDHGHSVPGEETLKKLAPHLRVPLVDLLDWAQEERERRAYGDEEAERLQQERMRRPRPHLLDGGAAAAADVQSDVEALLMGAVFSADPTRFTKELQQPGPPDPSVVAEGRHTGRKAMGAASTDKGTRADVLDLKNKLNAQGGKTGQKTAVPKIAPGKKPRINSAAGEPLDDREEVE